MRKGILIFILYDLTMKIDREKLLVITPKITKKVKNIRSKSNVYFSIDYENITYKGVKGKGTAKIIEDPKRTVLYGEKIYMKYLGTLDHLYLR